MSGSVYNSPLLLRKFIHNRFGAEPQSSFSSPARSIAGSLASSRGDTDSEADEVLEVVTETHDPSQTQTIVDGWVKFRDNKRWKQRWGVVTKLSPAADCLHLQLYRDSKDRYKQGHTKASLSLQHFLGVESGFTLDKESNTIAIICQDVIVVLAFDTRERLIQWQVKIGINLGEDHHFLVLISASPPKTRIPNGPARLHIQNHKFCFTTGVPPKLSGCWDIGHLRRYGVVEGRFCFEGGSQCGKLEGLYVLITDQGGEITKTLQAAAQGKLPTKKKPKDADSPRKSRPETRISDISYLELMASQINSSLNKMSRSLYSADETLSTCSCQLNYAADTFGDPCRCSRSPYWMDSSNYPYNGTNTNADLDCNYGCGDTVSVSEMQDMVGMEPWAPTIDNQPLPTKMERCVSCISKLGAPSMSRSSTGTVANTPCATGPRWIVESQAICQHVDRMSVCSSHASGSSGSGSGSEYSVPKSLNLGPTSPTHPPVPNKIVKVPSVDGTAPDRPPKPLSLDCTDGRVPSTVDVAKKCSCGGKLEPKQAILTNRTNQTVYDNYDVPRVAFKDESNGSLPPNYDNYDTPANVHEYVSRTLGRQTALSSIRKPCGCFLRLPRNVTERSDGPEPRRDCPCQRILPATCWLTLPYCKRGYGMENTTEPIQFDARAGDKDRVDMRVSIKNHNDSAIYATIDRSKKTRKLLKDDGNYENLEPVKEGQEDQVDQCFHNYENMYFAQSLENYENARLLLQKLGGTKEELHKIDEDLNEPEPSEPVADAKVCKKCRHCSSENKDSKAKADYLLMQPNNMDVTDGSRVAGIKSCGKNFPGYITMSPITASKGLGARVINKSASNPNLLDENHRPRDDVNSSSPQLAKEECDGVGSKENTLRRSNSVDSSQCVNDTAWVTSPSTETLRKCSTASLNPNEPSCPHYNVCLRRTSNASNETVTDETSLSDSLQTQVMPQAYHILQQAVNIRRSSSVPCKTGQNRDSSSSNDSGVSTGSLKHPAHDYNDEFYHGYHCKRLTAAQLSSLHASLPRKSKSSDPIRDLTFSFHGIKVPAKSSSAEAEVPICPTKKAKERCASSTDHPIFVDSRSTSSGTSDMSDYIETLSMSSHSSSDANDLRLFRQPTTTLRPRSGKEYHNIDRSMLVNQEMVQQETVMVHSRVKNGRRSSITGKTARSEKSESPGYSSGTSPTAQDV